MKRLVSTLWCDVRLQLRNGFYYATLFVLAIYALGLTQVSLSSARDALAWLLPAMLLNNLAITTFYFVAGLVLLEKAEGSLEAQIITPLRPGEYLASKVLTLTALAVLYNLAIVFLVVGFGVALLPVAAGVALGAAIYVLFGFAAVARYDSINEFLLPSTLYIAPLLLPLAYVAGWDSPLLFLHPMQGPVALMRVALGQAPAWQALYGVLYGGLWVGLAYALCRRSYRRFVVEKVYR
jgi:fluoroquinolone transport system permease protein